MGVRHAFSTGKIRAAAISGILVTAAFLSACAHFGTAPADDRLAHGTHSAIINDANIAYHVHGKGPICLVHPGGPGFAWDYLRMPELEKHLTLVYMEPVGSGRSGRLPNAADYTFERYAGDIEGLRQYLGLPRIYLLGHSHGGMVAQAYAINHSDRLKGLILLATTPVGGKEWIDDLSANLGWFAKEPWFNEALPALMGIAASKTSEEAAGLFKKAGAFYYADYTANKERIDPLLADIKCNLTPYLTFLTLPFDVRAQLHLIHAPTLVIGAGKDPIISLKFSEQIHNAIPGSRLAVLEKSGHMAHFDQPERLAEVISGFAGDVENTDAEK